MGECQSGQWAVKAVALKSSSLTHEGGEAIARSWSNDKSSISAEHTNQGRKHQ